VVLGKIFTTQQEAISQILKQAVKRESIGMAGRKAA
jgi:hypothetical protein